MSQTVESGSTDLGQRWKFGRLIEVLKLVFGVLRVLLFMFYFESRGFSQYTGLVIFLSSFLGKFS
jgi:hypothetical protein